LFAVISRLQAVHLVTDDITKQAQASAADYDATLDPFMPYIWKLLSEFAQEFERYRLDEIVVAAIAPTVRRLVSRWQPLEDPTAMLPTLRSMRGALKITEPEENTETQLDRFGAATIIRHAPVMVYVFS
jgi:tuftelin-interacting protein 11